MLAGSICSASACVLHYHSGGGGGPLVPLGAARCHPWLRLADEIVVPSRYLQDVFARHGYHTRVVRNVVDVGRFAYRERARPAAQAAVGAPTWSGITGSTP